MAIAGVKQRTDQQPLFPLIAAEAWSPPAERTAGDHVAAEPAAALLTAGGRQLSRASRSLIKACQAWGGAREGAVWAAPSQPAIKPFSPAALQAPRNQ